MPTINVNADHLRKKNFAAAALGWEIREGLLENKQTNKQ